MALPGSASLPPQTDFTSGVSHAENGDFLRIFSQHELQTPAAYHWFDDWFTERQSMPHGNREPIRAKILRFLTPEERLEGLTLGQRLAGLTPDERLVALAPATRLAGLAPEEQILALSDEVLRGLQEEYVRSLPRRVQQTIRKRLGTPR